ncbi:MAG: hypothetical protein AAGF48_08665 [Pseudomonadota bacterium]
MQTLFDYTNGMMLAHHPTTSIDLVDPGDDELVLVIVWERIEIGGVHVEQGAEHRV